MRRRRTAFVIISVAREGMAGIWATFRDSIRARLAGRKPEPPLSASPSVRRQKTYSADSGYVYLYYFDGFRETSRAWEYLFTVTADRRKWFPVPVLVSRETLGEWCRDHGRELGASERFAVAKIALRRAFDARESPSAMQAPISVDSDEMRAIAEFLDLL
jgi:hypothetical protein